MKNNPAPERPGIRPLNSGSRGQRTSASRLLFSVMCPVLVSFIFGCAAQWSIRTEQSAESLRWPYAPEKAKVSFVMALRGFQQETSAEAVLKAVVYGKENANDLFGLPVSVTEGADGRMAVADTGRNCVHLYIPGEKKYMRLSQAGDKEFLSPVGVAFDDELRLYVSDSQIGQVFVFGRDGRFISVFGGINADQLKRPTGLAFGRSNKLLYVVDTMANRIYAFNKEGRSVFSFGERGEEAAKFNYPTHIFWAPDHRLYITDSLNFRIEVFDESGRFLNVFGRHGDAAGEIAMPKGVAAGRDGTIYVVDALFDNVQLFSQQGEYLFDVGSRGSAPGEFWLPSGIFIDDNDKIYVCDPYNHRIQVFEIKEDHEINGK